MSRTAQIVIVALLALIALAACAIAGAAGLPVTAMQAAIQGFRGVAHRLEWIRRWGGAWVTLTGTKPA